MRWGEGKGESEVGWGRNVAGLSGLVRGKGKEKDEVG